MLREFRKRAYDGKYAIWELRSVAVHDVVYTERRWICIDVLPTRKLAEDFCNAKEVRAQVAARSAKKAPRQTARGSIRLRHNAEVRMETT